MPSTLASPWRLLAAKLSRVRCALLWSRAGWRLLRKASSHRCRTAMTSLRSIGRVVPCCRRGSPPVQRTHPTFRIEAGRHSTYLNFPYAKSGGQEGPPHTLIQLFSGGQDAPSVPAFLLSIGTVLLPTRRDAYQSHLEASDSIADGPSHRFLSLALSEKVEQIRAYLEWSDGALSLNPELRDDAQTWAQAVADRLSSVGGVGVGPSASAASVGPLPGSKPYATPHRPARDPRFWPCRFYWPDIVDPAYPYGEGMQLQLRSAISHLNEVWAIEAGGGILNAFADVLPWEWIHDSARWTYDESRHCRMGYERLIAWNLDPAEIPLGTYIYQSASGEDPIYRLGMLYFFETKNIRHKPARAQLFHAYGDAASEHDMDFDWADETMHAGYGKYWLKELLAIRGEDPAAYDQVRERCQKLVRDYVSTATAQEISAIKKVAAGLLAKAARSPQAGSM